MKGEVRKNHLPAANGLRNDETDRSKCKLRCLLMAFCNRTMAVVAMESTDAYH